MSFDLGFLSRWGRVLRLDMKKAGLPGPGSLASARNYSDTSHKKTDLPVFVNGIFWQRPRSREDALGSRADLPELPEVEALRQSAASGV